LGLTSVPTSNIDKRLEGDSSFEVGTQRGQPVQSFVDQNDGVDNQLFGGPDDVGLEDAGSSYADDPSYIKDLEGLESYLIQSGNIKKARLVSKIKSLK